MHDDMSIDKKMVLKFHPDKMSGDGQEDQAKNEAQFVCMKKGVIPQRCID